MHQSQKKFYALFFISLLAVDEASRMQSTASATIAALSIIRAVDGARTKFSLGDDGPAGGFFEPLVGLTDIFTGGPKKKRAGEGEPEYGCNQDVMIEFNGGQKQRIFSDQYKNAGSPFTIAGKVTPGQTCVEIYGIECVDGAISWEHRKTGHCKDWLTGMNANGTWDTEFGTVLNTYQEVSVTMMTSEQIVESRYLPPFPAGTTSLKVTPVPPSEDCNSLKARVAEAQADLTKLTNGLCVDTNSPQSNEVKGKCKVGEAPPLDKLAKTLNTFMSAKGALTNAQCPGAMHKDAASAKADMMKSPVMTSLKSMYSKMQASNMSQAESSSKFNNVLDSVTSWADSCRKTGDCVPTGPDLTEWASSLMGGTSAGAQGAAGASGGGITAEKLAGMAERLEDQPVEAEKAMRQGMSSLIESAAEAMGTDASSLIESNEEMLGGLWDILAWTAGIAAVLLLVYFLILLIVAVVTFIAVNILTILAIIGIGLALMFAGLALLCGGMKNISNEVAACKGSRVERFHRADEMGIPRWLVARRH